ncbi:MAG: CDP-alcohol phosphatidyltransferase family protein [Spirochaetia bacterium]|nr:CDP-alcohol phosphatidyltransferase family protein [Spirochaetia bacterium]
MGYKDIRDDLKLWSNNALKPIIALLHSTGMTPNAVTWIGFFINCASVYYIIHGKFIIAAIIILIAGIFDMLDGALARLMDLKSRFGGFLDSTLDRLSEGVIYFGLLVYYSGIPDKTGILLSYTVMLLSFLISYIRARAGGLKIDCEEGLFTRPERIVALVIGLFINRVIVILAVIAILGFITAVQRMWVVYIKSMELDKKNQ